MKNKKIAVVGKGTAGSQAILHFTRYLEDYDVVWYFDPNKPVQSVGEGSTIELPRNLYNALEFHPQDLPKIDGTFKTGIYKENWGTANKSFFHYFMPPFVSYHFNAVELQNYIYGIMKDKITIVEEEVNYDELDVDFVLNASGKPESYEDFHISEYIPVNSAYIVQCKWDYPRFDYTLTIARKHGWVFGIPLQNRCSIGYIYNKDITTEEEIAEDIQCIFEEYNLIPSTKPNKLSFNNYYRKVNFEENGRVAHTGNASFFLEPLEATSISTMDKIQRSCFDMLVGNTTVEQENQRYSKFINGVETLIMLHYASGSPFKTDFWEYAQERGLNKIRDSFNDPEFKEMYEIAKYINSPSLAPTVDIVPEYGNWWAGSYVLNLRGLGLLDIIDKSL